MATKKASLATNGVAEASRILKVGDVVEIRHSGGQRGRITEFRGALGPQGSNIYRLRVRRNPKPAYLELPEDQLVFISADAQV